MTAIMLTRIDERRNMARFYKLDIQPTLFGEWAVLREWAGLGAQGLFALKATRLVVRLISP